jgi:isopentenyl diphosphate isomerase/L-lactate dehydrogenase-like FMN-dependent dehydrogenase
MGGLKEGVITYLQTIQSELISAMVLTGTPGVEDVDARILREA